jgi:hypothetical protein
MYDPACEELAKHFLGNDAPPEKLAELAQHLQDTIELWLQ